MSRKCKNCSLPVKNMTWIFSCRIDGSLVENEAKSDGNLIIFLANAMEIPWLELARNPCHVPAWRTNKPGKMIWNSHGIWCGFGPNRHQVELWPVADLGISNLSSRLGRRKNGAPKSKNRGAPKNNKGRQKVERGARKLRGAPKN